MSLYSTASVLETADGDKDYSLPIKGGNGEQILRLAAWNMGGIPTNPQDVKMDSLFAHISNNEIDILGIPEMNVHWKKVPAKERLEARTAGWFESLKLSTAYFDKYNSQATYQAGGVSQWAINSAAHRVTTTGKDPSGLGRWTWQMMQGKAGINIRVITAYRPVLNRSGFGSVWSQQYGYFRSIQRLGDPRDLFTEDLCKEIQGWMEQGDQIALLIDANDDVRDGRFAQQLHRLGLTEAASVRAGEDTPATQKRGSRPIDGIFLSPTLSTVNSGYVDAGSDHLCVWVDIAYEAAFGYNPPPSKKPQARRLKMMDPRIVAKYLLLLRKWYKAHGLFERIEKLHNDVATTMTTQQEMEWESIDDIRVKGMLFAEKNCRQLFTGKVEWTPELAKLRRQETVWKLIVKRKEGRKGDSSYLAKLAGAEGMLECRAVDLPEAIRQLQDIKRQLREYKKSGNTRRAKWLEDLAAARASDKGRKRYGERYDDDEDEEMTRIKESQCENEYNQLRTREDQRKTAALIRRANGKMGQHTPLTRVIGPTEAGREEFTDKDGMEQALLQDTKRRYNQASDTPFMVSPLAGEVGGTGDSQAAEAILNGDYVIPDGVDPHARQLIEHLKQDENVQTYQVDVDVQGYRNAWKRTRERTSAGSELHFGHFKAGAECDLIGRAEALMAHMPYRTGYSPKRWQQGTAVMLLKEANNNNVEKMRTILLLPPDYNFNNKLLGRQLMYHAEEQSLIAPEQYGSRKALSAIEHCANKRLTFDIIRQTKVPAALCSNDAKGCYDRIVHAVATLAMRRLGLPKEPILSMFRTLQEMRHHIRTAYGDSNTCFLASDVNPIAIQGVGQGNGAGPQVWAAVSTVILNMLRAEVDGASFICPVTGEKFSFVGFSFVDDTDLIVKSETNESHSFQEAADTMQHALTTWEGGLRATGGALEPSKTFWYGIDFKWTGADWRYKRAREIPYTLEAKDPTGRLVEIERVEVSEARRTLGVRLAPTGCNQAELTYLKTEAARWANLLMSGHLGKDLSWHSLSATMRPKLQYPLAATTFSRKQASELDRIVRRAALPTCGVNRNFPIELVHGDPALGGIGIQDTYTVQGAEGVTRLAKFGQTQTHMVGQLLQCSYQWLQIELGLDENIFAQNYATWGPLAEATTLTATWKFAFEEDIQIMSPKANFNMLREGDTMLMPLLQQFATGSELKRINKCRLYLQVLTLAEIVDVAGNAITEEAWTGSPGTKLRPEIQWPNQGLPNKQDWQIWREALSLLCKSTRGVRTDDVRYRQLNNQLGPWIKTPQWTWWFDAPSDCLFHSEGKTREYTRMSGKTRHQTAKFQKGAWVNEVPATAIPAVVHTTRNYATIQRIMETQQSIQCEPVRTLRQRIDLLDRSARWAVESSSFTDRDVAGIISALQQGTAIAVSDGSFKNERGTASMIILGEGNSRIRADVHVPGEPVDQCSFRSEAAGMYSICLMTEILCEHFKIQTGAIEIACDGLSPLQKCAIMDERGRPQNKHYDFIDAIRAKIAKSPLTWTLRHVKGHQEGDDLDIYARLNEEMDTACKQWWKESEFTPLPKQQLIHGEPWAVFLGGTKVTSQLRNTLIQWCQKRKARSYWEKKLGATTCALIDWNVVEKVNKALGPQRQRWIAKHATGICGVRLMMKQMGKATTAGCPRCDETETAEHVWRCQDTAATAIWQDGIQEIRDWMQQTASSEVVEQIVESLNSWRAGTNMPESEEETAAVCKRQVRVGWRQFFEGKPAKGWQEAYQETARAPVTEAQGLRWVVALHVKLINVAWDLWAHRNGVLHDGQCKLAEEKLDEEVVATHAILVQELQRRRHVAKVQLDTILEWREQAKRDWLWVAKGAIEENKTLKEQRTNQNKITRHRRRSI
jgi:hypothetical protein